MKNAPMRFDGLSLRHNPEKLTVSNKNNLSEIYSPCCDPDSLSLGLRACRISGEGELCGADCIAQYQELEALHRAQRRAKLVLPRMKPIYAYLSELSLTAEPEENILGYKFTFVQAASPRAGMDTRCYVTHTQGESLFDISYMFGKSVDDLVSLNPQIPYIDNLRAGESVKLC